MHDKDRIEGTAKALAISRYLAAAMRSLTDLPPGRARKSSFKPLNIKDYSGRYAAGRTANVVATVLGKSSPRA